MLYDKDQLGEVGCGIIDIGNVKGIAVKRKDRGTFVDMDIGDAELGTLLQKAIGTRIGELIALGVATPLGGIEFDTLDVPFAFHAVQILDASIPVARVPGSIEDVAVGVG